MRLLGRGLFILWKRIGDFSTLQTVLGIAVMLTAAIAIAWEFFRTSPFLVQVILVVGILVGLLLLFVVTLMAVEAWGRFRNRKPYLDFNIVEDDDPAIAINRRVAVSSTDKRVKLTKVFVRITRFEPSDGNPEIRKQLVNLRRVPLMWTEEQSDQPSCKPDGEQGLPLLFDFLKQITDPQHASWANPWLYVCHGLSVEKFDESKHWDRSRIRGRRFVRSRREEVPKYTYDITLAAGADNAFTSFQNFHVQMHQGILSVVAV